MMTAMEWAAYCVLVSGVLGLAAWIGERSATEVGRPARGFWLGGMALSLVVPLIAAVAPAWRVPQSVTLVPALPSPSPIVTLDAISTGPASGLGAGVLLVALWIGLSVVVALRWVVNAAALRRERRSWKRAELHGEPVLRSWDTGPAVVGVRRPEVVLPCWAFEGDPGLTRLMLLHEREHVRAGDPWLLAASRLMLLIAPWNPVLWWMRERLRLAVELDCDARVVRAAPDVGLYGAALYEAGRRQSGPSLAVAFSERTPWLERRLRRLMGGARRRPGRSAALAVLALALTAVAVSARDPMIAAARPLAGDAPVVDDIREPMETDDGPALQAAVGARLGAVEYRVIEPVAQDTPPATGDVRRNAQQADPRLAPVFTPYTVAPRLLNAVEVRDALVAAYPVLLRDAGIGGEVLVWFYIDETGRVERTQVKESSGYPTLDEAALKIASVMDFQPAQNRDRNVAVWVVIPIKFDASVAGQARSSQDPQRAADRIAAERAQAVQRSRASDTRAAGGGAGSNPPPRARATTELPPPPATASAADIAKEPVFTPYTVAPRLQNVAEVRRELERNYPALLRDAGIGGEVLVWFYIDATGRVENTQLKEPSGYPALDAAALRVASMMRFEPAINRDKRVSVWVAIPIKFDTR